VKREHEETQPKEKTKANNQQKIRKRRPKVLSKVEFETSVTKNKQAFVKN